MLYKVVSAATARVVIHEKGKGLGPAFLKAAEELVKEGADGITTTGGFLAIFQKELAAHVNVPVAIIRHVVPGGSCAARLRLPDGAPGQRVARTMKGLDS